MKNVYLVDDDPAVRQSLSWLLKAVQIKLQTFNNAQSFLDCVDFKEPGCLLLDLCMPGMNGSQLQIALNQTPNTLAIVFLTGEADVPTTVNLFKQGAFDLLEKPIDSDVLIETIYRAYANSVSIHQLQDQQHALQIQIEQLSDREREIMWLVLEGMQNKQIAAHLCIALRTVEIHRHNMMKKMDCNTVIQLVYKMVSLERHDDWCCPEVKIGKINFSEI